MTSLPRCLLCAAGIRHGYCEHDPDPWWVVWLPRAVAALGWAAVISLVLFVVAPLLPRLLP